MSLSSVFAKTEVGTHACTLHSAVAEAFSVTTRTAQAHTAPRQPRQEEEKKKKKKQKKKEKKKKKQTDTVNTWNQT